MESFFQIVTVDMISISQRSLRDRKGSRSILSIFQKFTHTHIKLHKTEKRALSDTSSRKPHRASMTVEASFVLPIFLFCMMNILFSFRMLETQSRIYAAVHQIGNQICAWGYAEKYVPQAIPDGLLSAVVTEGYVRTKVLHKVGYTYLEHGGVKGGTVGLSFLGTDIMQHNDIVDIQVHWGTKPFIGNYGFSGFPTGVRYYGRAWTGYDGAGMDGLEDREEQMVYVAEHGTVYHRTRSCYHLNTTILQVPVGAIGEARNRDDRRYSPCVYCGGNNTLQPICYVTPEGDRYHYNANCSGLKRTVYTVPLSKVWDKSPCMSCN